MFRAVASMGQEGAIAPPPSDLSGAPQMGSAPVTAESLNLAQCGNCLLRISIKLKESVKNTKILIKNSMFYL